MHVVHLEQEGPGPDQVGPSGESMTIERGTPLWGGRMRDRSRVSIKQLHELPPTITVEVAAALAGVGRAAGYDAVRRDEWAHIHVGRRILVLTVPFLRQLGCDE